jgi:hypothetical protein
VVAELPALRAGQSLAEWKKNHAAGTMELYGGRLAEPSNERWCARVTFDTPIGANHRFRRIAYFYPPDAPTVIAMPVGTPRELLDQCRLGFVWAEIEDVDALRAERAADAAQQVLASVLGTGQLNTRLNWWGAAYWRKTAFWKQSELSVATATTSSQSWRKEGTTPRVLVAAAGRASNISLEPFQSETAPPEEAVEAFRAIESRINEAISIAAVGGTAETNVRSSVTLLSKLIPPWNYPEGGDRTFVLNAITDWLTAAPPESATRRAAALFVADQILANSAAVWNKEDNPAIRQRLEAVAAEFNWAPIGGVWVYTHSWLKQSMALDPDGRIGELAFITLMESGFETSGTCRDQGSTGFRTVVREGGQFLRRTPGSPLASHVHLLMAQAWGDIVTLATGGGYDESVSTAYKSDEASARKRAIEEYRLAFASPIQRPGRAREAWRNAWRLMAGLSPSRTYFYCVYD